MRRLIFWFFILLFTGWIALKLTAHPGNITLVYGQWTMKTPLWFSMIALFASFLIFYGTVRLFKNVGRLPLRYRHWRENKKTKYTEDLIHRGLIALAEGRWKRAEELLALAAENEEKPLVPLLGASWAAHLQSMFDRRDHYIQTAYQEDPDAEVAIGLTQVQLQMQNQQYEQALATLGRLRELIPSHGYVLKLSMQLFIRLKDWASLKVLLPALKKYRVLSSNDEWSELEYSCYDGLLSQASHDRALFQDCWSRLPRHLKKDEVLKRRYRDLI